MFLGGIFRRLRLVFKQINQAGLPIICP